jgi:hypothetical protein
MNGPHCPRCGHTDNWLQPEGKDYFECLTPTGAFPRRLCGYKHWLHNAPPPSETEQRIAAEFEKAEMAKLDATRALIALRARVRALVFAMMHSGLPYDKFDTEWLIAADKIRRGTVLGLEMEAELDRLRSKSIVTVAFQLDEEIEAIGQSRVEVRPVND